MNKDDYVRILDFLPRGKSDVPPHKRKPIAQAIGEKFFSLLEVVPKTGVTLESGERVYIGENVRDKVDHIERRIKYDWLTPTAKTELGIILVDVVKEQGEKFVEFYNTAGTISTRLHKLEILPRIGKRHRDDIVREREIAHFTSFEDMHARVKNIPDPAKVIAEKIVEELKGESKYLLFLQLIKDDFENKREHHQPS
jgi:putative nucleotide binding protein